MGPSTVDEIYNNIDENNDNDFKDKVLGVIEESYNFNSFQENLELLNDKFSEYDNKINSLGDIINQLKDRIDQKDQKDQDDQNINLMYESDIKMLKEQLITYGDEFKKINSLINNLSLTENKQTKSEESEIDKLKIDTLEIANIDGSINENEN